MLSRATIGRLPDYLMYLRTLDAGMQTISAAAIARGLSLGEVQVRKDLAAVCADGRPKTGYGVKTLSAALEKALGVHAQCEAVIVGAGKLGMALLDYPGFAEYGLCVRRAFDNNPGVLSSRVLPMESLRAYCMSRQADIGVIAVPPDSAQSVADTLIECGVKAIWCFAACRLDVPPAVAVRYENLALSLAHLKSKVYPTEKTEERV